MTLLLAAIPCNDKGIKVPSFMLCAFRLLTGLLHCVRNDKEPKLYDTESGDILYNKNLPKQAEFLSDVQ